MMNTTRRVDIHHHFLTSQYIEELAKVGVVESGGYDLQQVAHWKPEESLALMDRYGINTALLSVSAPGLCFDNPAKAISMARSLNEFAAQCVARWPNRFGFFATLPLPDVEASLIEIGYALDQLSADGIGLHSNHAGIYLGDPRFEAIFTELDRRAAVVHIHPNVFTGNEIPAGKNAGSPLPIIPGAVLEFVFDTTRMVANLIISGTLKRYPHIRIILSHAGGAVPLFAERLMLLDRSEIMDIFQKGQVRDIGPPSPEMIEQMMQKSLESTFSQLRGLYYDTALSANDTVLSALQRLVPSSHILLGTDYPFTRETGIRYALSGLAAYADWSTQDRHEIEANNALKLFPRLQVQ